VDFIGIKDDLPASLRWVLARLFRTLEPLLARTQSGLVFADEMIATGFKNVQCPKTVLFNYPEPSFLNQAIEDTHNTEARSPVVLYLGGLKRNRGTRMMVEAYAQVVRMVPEARLFLVGPFAPDNLEDEVRAHLHQLGLEECVLITGRVPFDRVSLYLKEASIGWVPFDDVPKYQKNIPTKLFEYMAYRLPVVSSDLAAVRPFIIDKENGLLVPPGDSQAHAQALLELLADPTQAGEMGRRGQELVKERYSWAEMEVRLLDLYSSLLPAGRSAPDRSP
jgi:glycosyltransferase involved in cell wall biosynthesis